MSDKLIGKKFGDWRVIAIDNAGAIWCQCACGAVKTVDEKNLRYGRSSRCQSCANTLRHAGRSKQ